MMLKCVILIGGPSKGTRFRPLSLDTPKPLFPIAGIPIIQHHIEACSKVKNLAEILIIGTYGANELSEFIEEMRNTYCMSIKYLQECTLQGSAGALYHFRDEIQIGKPTYCFVMNGDVCADFCLEDVVDFHKEKQALVTILATEALRLQSLNYGCMVLDKEGQVAHYVEKPSTFVSTTISCGIYLASLEIFQIMKNIFHSQQSKENLRYYNSNSQNPAYMSLERDILPCLAGTSRLYGLHTVRWWSQVKTAAAAIYANQHNLALYKEKHPDRLASTVNRTCHIIGDVYIHPSATVDSTAMIGPNVSIGPNVKISTGVRIKESIILANVVILSHSIVLHSIIGKNCCVGQWTRVEGTPCDSNPNKPFAKMNSLPLFNASGKLNPSVTILGSGVTLSSESILLNSIVLPNKQLTRSYKNEIIL